MAITRKGRERGKREKDRNREEVGLNEKERERKRGTEIKWE